MRTKIITLFLGLIVILGATNSLWATMTKELLTNGDFEQSSFGSGWNGIRGDSQYSPGLSGSNALFIKGYDSGGVIGQSFSGANSSWQLDLDFLTEKVGSSPFSGFRFMLNYDNSNSSEIYFVTKWSGTNASIAAYNSSNGMFETIIPNVITSSSDYNGDGDYEDAGDYKSIYHLKMNGFYDSVLNKAFYDIAVYDKQGTLKGQALNISFFNRNNPGSFVPYYLLFPTSFPERNLTPSVVDNISFTTVPEPTTLLLLGIGSVIIRSKRKS